MASDQLIVKILNVGQGNAAHLVLPTGEHMLIDINLDRKSGGIDVIKYLAGVLPTTGEDGKHRLDYLVITHPHNDHIRGVGQLGNQFEIGEMWESGHRLDCDEGDNPEYDKYLAVIKKLGDKVKEVCAASAPWCTVGDVTFHVFRPSSYVTVAKDQTEQEKRDAIHNECMVLKVTYGDTTVLFTGDSHKGAWESIVQHYNKEDLLGADILIASHHGSRTFYKCNKDDKEPLLTHLDAIAPEFVVISVGADNEYEHPDSDMLTEYEARVGAANVYRTDEDLTVIFTVPKQGAVAAPEANDADFQREYQLPDEDEGSRSGSGGGGQLAGAPAVITNRWRDEGSRTTLPEEQISA